jgi:hypothetical protein
MGTISHRTHFFDNEIRRTSLILDSVILPGGALRLSMLYTVTFLSSNDDWAM